MRNKLIDLNNALFVELETLQDEDLFVDESGNYDKEKIELRISRAEKVAEIASRIIEVHRVTLDAYKLASNNGLSVKIPNTLGLEDED